MDHQSTAFALTFLCEVLGVCNEDGAPVGPAWEWFDNRLANPALGRLTPYANGGFVPPTPGTLIVYDRNDTFAPWGHVAVVVSLDLQEGQVEVAQQNCIDCSSTVSLDASDGRYTVEGALGWLQYGVSSVECVDNGVLTVGRPHGGTVVPAGGPVRVEWSPRLPEFRTADVWVGYPGGDSVAEFPRVDNAGSATLQVDVSAPLPVGDGLVACVQVGPHQSCSALFEVVAVEDCADGDGDGYGIGVTCLGTDCDDDDPAVNLDATEQLNWTDDDCDGLVDEDYRTTFHTVHIGFWGSCAGGAGDGDHCLGNDGARCWGDGPVQLAGARTSVPHVRMYAPSIVQELGVERDGEHRLIIDERVVVALRGCRRPASTEHWYVLGTDPMFATLMNDSSVRCYDGPLGYVPETAIEGASVMFRHNSSILTDRHYSFTDFDSTQIGCFDVIPTWSAWDGLEPPYVGE